MACAECLNSEYLVFDRKLTVNDGSGDYVYRCGKCGAYFRSNTILRRYHKGIMGISKVDLIPNDNNNGEMAILEDSDWQRVFTEFGIFLGWYHPQFNGLNNASQKKIHSFVNALDLQRKISLAKPTG